MKAQARKFPPHMFSTYTNGELYLNTMASTPCRQHNYWTAMGELKDLSIYTLYIQRASVT